MDYIVHGFAKSRTRLSDFCFTSQVYKLVTFYFYENSVSWYIVLDLL